MTPIKLPLTVKSVLSSWMTNIDYSILNVWEDNTVYYITLSILHKKSVDIIFVRVFGTRGSEMLSQDRKVTIKTGV